MRVQLKAIKFNYRDLSTTGAFHLRRNETQIVKVPEWEPHTGTTYESSPVAYSISDLPATITIQAVFEAEGGGAGTSVLVKATAESAGHVLGNVQQESILGTGPSGLVTFKLTDARTLLSQAGIGIHDIVWRWHFSDKPETWTDFQITRHRIYTVLARPYDPWQPEVNNPANIHQPWTEVLDYACKWAEGVRGKPEVVLDEAARLITDSVHDLGATLLSHKSGAEYAHDKFDCTRFLELLRTGIGPQKVNCEDCATIVSTFANVLGCQLWQSSMGGSDGFDTNHILRIGDRHFEPTGFFQHTVAWKGKCLEQDLLFDSFLQVDGDDKPGARPVLPLRPSGTTFGAEKEKSYKFRLVDPESDCWPTPQDGVYTRQRRKLGRSYRGAAKISSPEAIKRLRDLYHFDSWPKISSSKNQAQSKLGFSLDMFYQNVLFPNWKLHSSAHFSDEQFRSVTQLLFRRLGPESSMFLTINLYECHGVGGANDSLLQILAAFNQPTLRMPDKIQIGEVVFADEELHTVVFRSGSFIGMVDSAGRQNVNVDKIAGGLYEHLQLLSAARESANESPLNSVAESESEEEIMNEEEMQVPEAAAVEDPHPLAHMWRSFRLVAAASGYIVLQGRLDLRSLTPDGILTAGVFYPERGEPVLISGKVSEIGGLRHIRLERGAYARYDGLLTYNRDGVMVISGKLIYEDPVKTLDDGSIRQQQEEPWVILKP